MSKLTKKLGLVALIILGIVFYYKYNLNQWLNLESLKQHHQELLAANQKNPLSFILAFMGIYILLVALSFPGATILSLAGGYIFGFIKGLIIINWASTIGASGAFLISRYLFKDYFQKKFHQLFYKINQGMDREGNQYLFTLRLVPIFPFFMINVLMGLTNISLIQFFIISLIGMLPGTAVYVWAGTSLHSINSIQDIFSIKLGLIFFVIGFFPILLTKIMQYLKQQKHYAKFKRPKHFDYNLMVIGGGAAGLVNAYIAANLKAKVLLIEESKMGGECLNFGCVPSKALLSLSKSNKYSATNFTELKTQIAKIIQSIAPHDSIERYQNMGVECINGKAKIISPYAVQVNDKIYTAKKMVIATGAKPYIPNIKGLDHSKILHYENIWQLEALPNNLLIIGGGAIGCELAIAFSQLGSKVTIVEANELLATEDRDVIELVKKGLENHHISLLEHVTITAINHIEKKLLISQNDRSIELAFDEVLFACGKVGNTDWLQGSLDFDFDGKKFLIVNEYLETLKYKNIYACGDVNGLLSLTNAAADQAWYSSINALFGNFKKFTLEQRHIPRAIFLDPELARVGLNERDAKMQNHLYDVYYFDSSDLDRSLIERKKWGMIKVLTIKDSDQILGVTIVGEAAAEIIAEFVLAMKYQLGLNKILSTSHIYPSFAEQNKYVAGVWRKRSVIKYWYKVLEVYHKLVR